MRQTNLGLFVAGLLALGIAGCGAEEEEGFSLKIPGIVDVDVDEDGSTKVKTGGTDVDVNRKDGKVKVRTPQTNVDVE